MKKLFAILFSLLILLTNIGFTFSTHFCNGKAIKTAISLGTSDISCGMNNMDQSCENISPSAMIDEKNCCENTYIQLKIKDNYQTKEVFKSTTNFQFIAVFIVAYLNFYSFNASTKVEYSNYSPPLLDLDIPVLIQSFLL